MKKYKIVQAQANDGFDVYGVDDDPQNDRPIGVVLRQAHGFTGFAKNENDMPLGPARSVEQAADWVWNVYRRMLPA